MAKLVVLALALPGLCLGQFPGTHGALPKLSSWYRWESAGSSLKQHVTADALQLLKQRKEETDNLETADDWKGRQETLRELIPQVLTRGIPTERTPLNVKVTKKNIHPGTNATIEMLYFESRPNFFVTAGLWRPADDAPGKDPVTGLRAGVLYASGHSCQGWRRFDKPDFYDYQFLILNLVRKGFVVLAYDPPSQGERCMYCNGTCGTAPGSPCTRQSQVHGCSYSLQTGQLLPWSGGATNEHSYYHRQLLLNNATASSVWIWDGSRALDVLHTTTGVDSEVSDAVIILRSVLNKQFTTQLRAPSSKCVFDICPVLFHPLSLLLRPFVVFCLIFGSALVWPDALAVAHKRCT
jgi:hypothetical protein